MSSITLGIVGDGEVGKTFAAGLQGKPGVTRISACDANFQPIKMCRSIRFFEPAT